MAYINYEDKVSIQENPVAEKNKVTAKNFNEIKRVVNENAKILDINIVSGSDAKLIEKWENKDVYMLKIDIPSFPRTNSMVDINLSDYGISTTDLIGYNVCCWDANNYFYDVASSWFKMNGDLEIRCFVFVDTDGSSKLRIATGPNSADFSTAHGFAVVKFTKETQ